MFASEPGASPSSERATLTIPMSHAMGLHEQASLWSGLCSVDGNFFAEEVVAMPARARMVSKWLASGLLISEYLASELWTSDFMVSD
jgi:hypothetical protein